MDRAIGVRIYKVTELGYNRNFDFNRAHLSENLYSENLYV